MRVFQGSPRGLAGVFENLNVFYPCEAPQCPAPFLPHAQDRGHLFRVEVLEAPHMLRRLDYHLVDPDSRHGPVNAASLDGGGTLAPHRRELVGHHPHPPPRGIGRRIHRTVGGHLRRGFPLVPRT